jgi:isopenicillin-N N-acyltransferase-like protein
LPSATADGSTLLGQNWDWLIHTRETLVVLEICRRERPSLVTVVEAGLLAKMGMNSAGLGVATNFLLTKADDGRAGVPYHSTLRAILDCETITDALIAL